MQLSFKHTLDRCNNLHIEQKYKYREETTNGAGITKTSSAYVWPESKVGTDKGEGHADAEPEGEEGHKGEEGDGGGAEKSLL